jgi:hypothetical protein
VPREIDDGDGVRWSCAQAYAGLADQAMDDSAARVEGTDRYRVICTPSGGSRSVELELAGGWEESLSDEDLLDAIRQRGT